MESEETADYRYEWSKTPCVTCGKQRIRRDMTRQLVLGKVVWYCTDCWLGRQLATPFGKQSPARMARHRFGI